MAALQKTKPVIFLAFANSSANPLPHLAEECRRLTSIVEDAAHEGICDVLVRPYATVDQILDAFDQEEQRGRIAVFHYAGHADGFALLLEGADGAPAFETPQRNLTLPASRIDKHPITYLPIEDAWGKAARAGDHGPPVAGPSGASERLVQIATGVAAPCAATPPWLTQAPGEFVPQSWPLGWREKESCR